MTDLHYEWRTLVVLVVVLLVTVSPLWYRSRKRYSDGIGWLKSFVLSFPSDDDFAYLEFRDGSRQDWLRVVRRTRPSKRKTDAEATQVCFLVREDYYLKIVEGEEPSTFADAEQLHLASSANPYRCVHSISYQTGIFELCQTELTKLHGMFADTVGDVATIMTRGSQYRVFQKPLNFLWSLFVSKPGPRLIAFEVAVMTLFCSIMVVLMWYYLYKLS